MVFSALQRIYSGFISPPPATKKEGAIRFGLLGASNIAPIALINPAKAHPDVIIAAVAARDRNRAETYAKKYDIPIVHASYEDLLNDPSVDAVYISLPNCLHYEWAVRAIRAGKHVLLEKPSCANSEEARALFNHPLLQQPGAPIVLEAFHYRFHPAWQTFLSFIHQGPEAGPVRHALAQQYAPNGMLPADDIRWRYDLAGGAMMDFGTYPMHCLRQIWREEPTEVVEAEYRPVPVGSDHGEETQVDQAMTATYRTATGATGKLIADLAASGGWPLLPTSWSSKLPGFGWPKCEVELGEKEVEIVQGESRFVKRKVTIWNHLVPSLYHRIDVEDTNTTHRDGQIVRTWKETKHVKAYTWPSEDEQFGVAKEWWPTYLYQLHEFVSRVKGGQSSGAWVDGDDSIKQMEAVDRTYEKAGLRIRPTSSFEL
ncbi:hypothetical protein ETB97_007855 [Aspergillus alliaceus]|uniref:D-xylose 1-dehydrogenase (NADP(+), D-xylono-1,5-lactone-forming) n=1 Tax=Petromyces alliaceus TaxID=209559 RepID=A0A5N6G2E0_PETAA|nr:uncharacterized protein BDW43DRAFT_271448 [Aspergillus alliaceus]KAB8235274.1 hypothetical protein BDW43DRAFT_271448 [Aspergillus alliaceus]KAF5856115.1 hypothetical protein ETB97_007855 [Aspergillus burnettii]